MNGDFDAAGITSTAANHFALGLQTQANEIDVASLPVDGGFPSWLTGALYRNGPARFEVGDRPLKHWFDGFAMIHRFEFRADGIGYRNRFIRSKSYTRSLAEGRLFDMQFATNARESWAGNVWAFWKNGLSVTDNTAVSLMPGPPGELIALTEAKNQLRIDARSLETLGPVQYEDKLKHVIGSAHPHYDFAREETVTYSVNFARVSEYLIHRLRKGSRSREVVARIPVKRPGYMHSFLITENHAVLTEFPLTGNPLAFLFSGAPFIDNYRWDASRATAFIVVDRRDGRVRRFEAEPLFAFHHVNAWEAGRDLFVDLCAYPDAAIIGELALDQMRAPRGRKLPALRRYRLALDTGKLHGETLLDEGLELPRIAYRAHNARAYRHVYGVSNDDPQAVWNRLLKADTQAGSWRVWKAPHCYPGEPVFVGEPGAAREDQGVVLSLVLDAVARHSFLVALDAESFEELGRAQLPLAVPYGFHGLYID